MSAKRPVLALLLAAGLLWTACGVATVPGDDDVGDVADADVADVVRDGDADVGDDASGTEDGGDETDACVSACGNGALECAEQCDDGNTVVGDGCDDMCAIEVSSTCGDGNVDYAAFEQCDDGNSVDGDGCSSLCRIESPVPCGDGTLDLAVGEQCDDGNTIAGDGCSPACRFETVGATCGDGSVDGREVCDDGNMLNGDSCNPTCNLANATTLFLGSPGHVGLVDGSGTAARLGGTGALAIDATHLYLADGLNRVVRRIEIATATVQTIAGDAAGGPAGWVDAVDGLNARFGEMGSIATDGTTLWVGDEVNFRIRAIDLVPPFAVTTVAGSGVSAHIDGIGLAAAFGGIRGLTYHAGHAYLVEPGAATLRRFDPASGEVITLAGTPGMTGTADGLGASARFVSPRYMTSDGTGMLYIADTNGNTIRSYNTVTTFVGTFAGNGSCGYLDGIGPSAAVHRPRGMTSDGTSIYWVEFNAHTLRQGVLATAVISTLAGTPAACMTACSCTTAPPGGYVEGTGAAAVLDSPFAVAFHYPTNSLFVLDGGNAVIRRIR